MPTADEILAELRAHRRAIATMFAAGDEDAAATHEADATRHRADAMRHAEAAKKARDDNDEEDAKRHEENARKSRMDAMASLNAARQCYEASATSLAASDETAAKSHTDNAKRLGDEAAALKASQDAADAEAARREEDAAAKKKGVPMWAMFLRAMMDDDEMSAMKDTDNLALLKRMMGMAYPPGRTMSKRGQDAQHDDVAEDTALFRRLMKQYKDDDLSASRSVPDIRQERRMRAMEGAMGEMKELLTDVVHGLRNLATDTTHGRRDLATDQGRGKDGGPVRKTLSATGTDFRGKYDDVDDGKGAQTPAQIEAVLDAQGMTDPVQRMAAKLTLMNQGTMEQ